MNNSESCRSSHPALLMVGIAFIAGLPALFAAGIPPFATAAATCVHLIRLCMAAFKPADWLLHAAPIAIIGAGLLRAAHRQIVVMRHTTGVVRRIAWRRPRRGEVLHELVVQHQLTPSVRVMTSDLRNPAFTAGVARPHIYISHALQQQLTRDELEAVLLHEACHHRRRDPFRIFAAAVLADVLFWIPLVRNTFKAFSARLEFSADDAARVCGDTVLASAILKLAESRVLPEQRTIVAFSSSDLTKRRLERVLGAPEAERESPPSRRTVLLSAFALVFVWLFGITSPAAHAAHQEVGHVHCPHHHEFGVLHAKSTGH